MEIMQPSDNRLVFNKSVPKLQDMAAFRIALNMTMNYVNRILEGKDDVSRCRVFSLQLFHQVRKYINEIKPFELLIPRTMEETAMVIYETTPDVLIPRVLEEMIKKYVVVCCDEIQQWLDFYGRFVSISLRTHVILKEFLSNVVWKPNGKIDHHLTAFNLVNSTKLKKLNKFRIMCEFCMEEKIRDAWFKVQNHHSVKIARFHSQPLLVYWYCVMTEDFSKIADCNNIDLVGKHVLLTLKHKKQFSHFPAVEYFFNQLDVDSRIEVGGELMKNWHGWTRFLISKYSEEEQYRLFSTWVNVIDIFSEFTNVSHEYLHEAITLWNHIKHLVDGDQYVNILKYISSSRNFMHDEQLEFLEEFWHATPQNLKEYLFQPKNDEEHIVFRQCRYNPTIITRTFWHHEWDAFLYGSPPSRWEEIQNLYFSKDNITRLKKEAMSTPIIGEYFVKIIEMGNFQVLNEFLRMFIDGGQLEINNVKRELFEKANINNMYDTAVASCEETEEGVNALIEFLKVVFRGDVKRESKFKMQIILRCFNQSDSFIRNTISKIIYVSDRICDAALLEEVKNQILKRSKHLLFTNNGYANFKRGEWNGLLLWCLGNQQQVEEFKNSSELEVKRRKLCSFS